MVSVENTRKRDSLNRLRCTTEHKSETPETANANAKRNRARECVCASTRRVFFYARLSIPFVRAKHAEEGFPPCVGGHEVPRAKNAAAAVKRGENGGYMWGFFEVKIHAHVRLERAQM